MKINRDYQVELIVGKDVGRPQLRHAYLDVENKKLIATDGSKLVVVPVKVEEGDTSGFVSIEVLKQARKEFPKKGNPEITINAEKGKLSIPMGPSFPRPSDGEAFPPYESVIPKTTENAVSISFNAKYLLELALAMGADKQDPKVTITFDSKDSLFPIMATTHSNEGAGVLMPVRK